MHDYEEIDYSLIETVKKPESLKSKIEKIIDHLEDNEAIAAFDVSFYKKKLERLLEL